MGEEGRKLTIRVPDSEQLSSAEVLSVHVPEGGHAGVGAPVMTLLARRRPHVLRAPRPGRIVPLVAPGDRVRGGDPLYVLNIDERALAQRNANARALLAVEKARWTSGGADEQAWVARRARQTGDGRLKRLFATWWGPVLAIAFYVAACFAFLPLIGTVSGTVGTAGRLVLLAASLLLGVLMFRLYSARLTGLPRAVVGIVSIGWVAIATVAVLHRPDGADDLTLGAARDRIAGLLRNDERPVQAEPPAPVRDPMPVEGSGIQAGAPDLAAVAPAEPRTRLSGQPAPTPDAHGIVVRAWGRQNPSMQSGEPVRYAGGDEAMPAQAAPRVLAVAEPEALEVPNSAGSPPPDVPARSDLLPVDVAMTTEMTSPQTADGPVEPKGLDAVSPGGAIPAMVASAAPRATGLPARREPWLLAGVPVISDDGAVAPEAPDAAPASPGAQVAFARGPQPALSAEPDAPGPALAALPVAEEAPPDAAPAEAPIPKIAVRPDPSAEGVSSPPAGARQAEPGAEEVDPVAGREGERGPRTAEGSDDEASDAGGDTPGGEELAAARSSAGTGADASAAPSDANETASEEEAPVEAALAAGQPGDDGPAGAEAATQAAPADEAVAVALTRFGAVASDWMAGVPTPGQEAPAAGSLDAADRPERASTLAPSVPEAGPAARGAEAPPMPEAGLPAPLDASPGAAAADDPPPAGKGPGDEPAGPALPEALQLALASPSDLPSTLPTAEASAERRLLFLYYDDPRIDVHPRLGDQWLPALGSEAAAAIRSATVEAVREVVEVTDWCSNGEPAALSDRIRLVEVRLTVDPEALGRVEAELPVLAGAPPALFHNRAPLLGGDADAPLMRRALDFLGIADEGSADVRYFDSPAALTRALGAAGCRRVEWNGGEGPANEIGHAVERRLDG